MKKFVLSTLLAFWVLVVIADNSDKKSNSIQTINANDTIVVDLANQTLVGNKIAFPVLILSDDTIYSLDFSFKYNQTLFNYDTILNLSSSLQSNCYYNTTDSTVRYTCFSLDTLSKNVNLVSVELTTFSSYLCNQDIYAIKGFLNGDVCSIKLINCLSAGINDNNLKRNIAEVFPNPVDELLNITSTQNAAFVLLDVNGRIIVEPTSINKIEGFVLNTKAFKNGVFFLKVYNDSFISIKKLVVKH